jgi:DNA polymerase
MGAVKFQAQLKTSDVTISLDEARRIVEVYRQTNYAVTALWRQAQMALVAISRWDDGKVPFGRDGVLEIVTREAAIRLPNGLYLRYDDLKLSEGEKGPEFTYRTRKGRTRIYGGKVVENVCQALARCLIAEQMLKIAKRYRVVLTVHDAVACIVPDAEVAEAQAYVEECMRWTPEWAAGLPVNCESGVGKSYGDC